MFASPLLRKKLAIRLQDAAEALGVANARNASLERARHRLQLELGDTLWDLGKARASAAILDRKQQHFDKCCDDWRQKQEESQAVLEASQEEARALSVEVLKLRHACEESTVSQETLQRANRNLQGTLSWARSQSRMRRCWGAPVSRGRAARHGRTPRHCRGPAQVFTFPFLILFLETF